MNTKIDTSRHSAAPVSRDPPIVFVVDDDVSVRESLELLIRVAGWQPRTFASAGEFLACPRVLTPSCLILDVTLPDFNGLEVQNLIANRTEMPIIFITGHADVPMTVRAMKAGAIEFLTKPFGDEALLSAIRSAIERSRLAVDAERGVQGLRERYALLSRREQQVMSFVIQGMLNKLIGAELGISEITVKAHRGSMMRKMQAQSVAELVTMASRLSLVPAPEKHGRIRRAVLAYASQAPRIDERCGVWAPASA
jgi:FixJ family two-component response regulator